MIFSLIIIVLGRARGRLPHREPQLDGIVTEVCLPMAPKLLIEKNRKPRYVAGLLADFNQARLLRLWTKLTALAAFVQHVPHEIGGVCGPAGYA
jgi:hypothetical protein